MITLEQIRAARALLGLKQQELAKKAGVSISTLNNIERGAQTDPKISTLRAIQRAFEQEGIEFTSQDTGAMGLYLKSSKMPGHVFTLLIIDDNISDRTLYKAWLSKQPNMRYRILEADNAKTGYEAFVRYSPACIILDFKMYGMDGFQLLVEMKQKNPVIPPIIFITGQHNPTVETNVRAQGVNFYLTKKDLSKEQLYEAVSKALA